MAEATEEPGYRVDDDQLREAVTIVSEHVLLPEPVRHRVRHLLTGVETVFGAAPAAPAGEAAEARIARLEAMLAKLMGEDVNKPAAGEPAVVEVSPQQAQAESQGADVSAMTDEQLAAEVQRRSAAAAGGSLTAGSSTTNG